ERDGQFRRTDRPNNADRMFEQNITFEINRMRDDLDVATLTLLASPHKQIRTIDTSPLVLGVRLALLHVQSPADPVTAFSHASSTSLRCSGKSRAVLLIITFFTFDVFVCGTGATMGGSPTYK